MSKAKALNVIQLFYEQFGLFLFLFFRIENFGFSLEKLIYVSLFKFKSKFRLN